MSMWKNSILMTSNHEFIKALIQVVWLLFSPLIATYCYVMAKHRDGIPRLFFNVFAIITIVHSVSCIIQIPVLLWVIIPESFIAILIIAISQGEDPNAQ